MIRLGIAAFYHDAAACIIIDGRVIAAAEEERFTEIKHDASFPINAIKWCLSEAVISIDQVDEVYWYENPFIKDDRVAKIFKKHPFKTYFLNKKYKKEREKNDPFNLLKKIGYKGNIIFSKHHNSHSAFSYFTSPYRNSAILSIDGVGEWETTTISKGVGDEIIKLYSIDFPHSLGMLYSTITSYLGFKPNEGEYKVMGLAPYGDPSKYLGKLEKVLQNRNGKYYLLQRYFTWEYDDRVMFNKKLCQLLELPPRLPENTLNQDHKDLAASLQKLYEREFLKLVKIAKELTNSDNLCLSGGCAYNGVANSLAYKYFKSVHIPFAPSDAGSAIGACLDTHIDIPPYLGPAFGDRYVKSVLDRYHDKVVGFKLTDEKLSNTVAELINAQNIVAWFQGRMEFGARALGNRSILASPKDLEMRTKLNFVIKKREGFRPFAPSVLEDQAHRYFEIKEPVPHMNQVVQAKVNFLPAATHVDGSCRVQTVTEKQNKKYYDLIAAVGKQSGIPVVLNTSFNLKDQTITMTPEQAIERFISSDINYLVINNFLIKKI
jgi:carbamoyltransferase